MGKEALIVVDVQNDFCEGGALAVEGGAAVARAIYEHIESNTHSFASVVATKDWHIDPGNHFSDNPDFVDSWPKHCVADTHGANFHRGFRAVIDKTFFKGQYSAAYSGFEGKSNTGIDLAYYLKRYGITDVDVVGIATDYCVKATALDAVKNGFNTRVLVNLTAAVNKDNLPNVFSELNTAGVEVVV